MRRIVILTAIVLAAITPTVWACENALSSLVGYTLLAASDVDKDQLREVSDGKSNMITLRNDMSFRFPKTPKSHWGYTGLKTGVFVFSRGVSEREADWYRKNGQPPPTKETYTLLIDGSTYDVQRVK